MSIREKVARAMYEREIVGGNWDDEATGTKMAFRDEVEAAITAFLEVAAEQGWRMRPDEATEEMGNSGAATWDVGSGPWNNLSTSYRAMLAAAPPFEWDK